MKLIIGIGIMLVGCTTMPKERFKTMDPVISSSLQGDVKTALLGMPDASTLSNQKDLALRDSYIRRFVNHDYPGPRTGDQFVDAVIKSYEDYWDQVLLQSLSNNAGVEYLYNKLKLILDFDNPYTDENFDKLTAKLKSRLLAHGYHGIYGTTLPYSDLMLWRKQSEKEYKIEYSDGMQKVRVVLLEDFAALGWSAYATFETRYTGGWAEKDKLFCVTPSWDLASENFQVSFLAHEGRHFRDYEIYPNLQQADMEYRAKLTELILADTSIIKLIRKFKSGASLNKNSPHAFANHFVIADIERELAHQNSLL